MQWSLRDQIFSLHKTRVMGIMNITPDSFSDGGLYFSKEWAVAQAEKLIEAGADILDLGAESTRPQALPINSEEEISRVLSVLKVIRKRTTIPISIDTTKYEVAKVCLEEGADIINDVSGLSVAGIKMAELVKKFEAGLVLMHRRGTPETMQTLTSYGDVVEEVFLELEKILFQAMEWGIPKEKIVLDPGIGFSKDTEQNLDLIAQIDRFFELGQPVLLGPSRKRFIGDVTGKDVRDRDFGTAAVIAWAALKQVPLVRVHDVEKMKDVLKTLEAIQGVKHVRTF